MATPPNQFITNVDRLLLESIENNVDVSTIEEILYGDNYVNINVQTLLLETPLHIATKNNNKKLVECLLLNKNTRPNVQNVYGDTAVHIAIRNGYIDIVKILLDDWRTTHWITNKNKETILHLSLSRNIIEVYPLIKKQFITSRDIVGYTPFMYAILQYNQTKDIRYRDIITDLLNHGAIVEIPDILEDIGETWKSFIYHPKFDIYSEIKENTTLFSYSCDRGDKELIEYYCKNSIVSTIENIEMEKGILLSIKKQHIDICIKLLTLDISYNNVPMNSLVKQMFYLYVLDEDDLIRVLDILLESKRITKIDIIKFCMVYYKQYVFKKYIDLELLETVKINIESIIPVCCVIYPGLFTFIIDNFDVKNDILDKNGNTLLNIAVQHNLYSNQLIRKLIKKGCDPNHRNRQHKKPLDYAIIHRNTDIIRELLPITTLTLEDRFILIEKSAIIPSNLLIQTLNIDWIDAIKIMKVGTYLNVLDLIDDSGDGYKKELMGYIIGKEDKYRRILEVLVNIKNISIENSHNTEDIWTLETIEDEEIIQYGKEINGKYKTLTIHSVIELVRQTEDYVSLGYIKDPFDRSSLTEQLSYPNKYPFFIEILLRKLTA